MLNYYRDLGGGRKKGLDERHDVQCAYNESEDIMGIATNNEARSKRFNLRATPKQDSLIRVAAKRRGLDVTDFIIESACEKAQQTLADQAHFVLDQQQWDLFMKALDEPPQVIPQIKRLFAEPPISESR